MKNLIVIILNLLALLSINHIQSMDYKDDINKDGLLEMIINTIKPDEDSSQQLSTAISLIENGANPNIIFMGESLLHKALILNNKDLVQALLKNNVNYNDTDYVTQQPIFFDAQTVEIAQLFVDKGTDVNQVDGNGYNVLWHLIDHKFPVKLMRFYLKNKVNISYICPWDKTSILHNFAVSKEVINENDFLAKVRLVLKANPTLVNTLDNNNETPMVVAENTIKSWGEKYPLCVKTLESFIGLCKEYQEKII